MRQDAARLPEAAEMFGTCTGFELTDEDLFKTAEEDCRQTLSSRI